MNYPPKVLLVARFHPCLKEKLEVLGYECVFKEALPYEKAMLEISDYEGLVTSNHLPVDKNLIDAAKRLKWVGRLGSGMEIIDVVHAQKRGIACFSSPEGNANAVAEQALGMLLLLRHNILKANREMRSQNLWLRNENRGDEIENATAGIIGLGNNGSAFAKKLLAMDVKVLAYDKFQNHYDMPGIIPCNNLETILKQATILSFHVPLNAGTRYYFDEKMLVQMQHPFILLNLSRGSVVKQDALFRGMKTGKIIGAALDVWEEEPYWKNKSSDFARQAEALMALPNFIGTPHIAGYTHDALYKMSKVIAEKVTGFLKK